MDQVTGEQMLRLETRNRNPEWWRDANTVRRDLICGDYLLVHSVVVACIWLEHKVRNECERGEAPSNRSERHWQYVWSGCFFSTARTMFRLEGGRK